MGAIINMSLLSPWTVTMISALCMPHNSLCTIYSHTLISLLQNVGPPSVWLYDFASDINVAILGFPDEDILQAEFNFSVSDFDDMTHKVGSACVEFMDNHKVIVIYIHFYLFIYFFLWILCITFMFLYMVNLNTYINGWSI